MTPNFAVDAIKFREADGEEKFNLSSLTLYNITGVHAS
jgi:hypothetical protein